MKPDLIIVGDSHCGALQSAALAAGLKSEMFSLSGNHWHENQIRPHKRWGMMSKNRRPVNVSISKFSETIGGSIFSDQTPVLASIGYHLGRMVPPFSRAGHTSSIEQAIDSDEAFYVSDAFVDAFLEAKRGQLFRLLKWAHKRCDLTVIAPPIVKDHAETMLFRDRITALLRDEGINVFDPFEDADLSGRELPAKLRAEDGVHGNVDYGAMVLRRLFAENGLNLAA
ncbi:hypothetical protein [Donghicola mangrovi]|uniref:SGNH/GDSL hydrolase family protein n=1 Tax=Donghicola mangrovi TaxID=2729614 RepID=A0A850Q4Y5_9RHOB|nr:hypothetical protein [Donghicola mangrovi]NVO24777.1 hypothetical protein [Donghicola mangrovi]